MEFADAFADFQAQHTRSYDSAEEHQLRCARFADNSRYIKRRNKEQSAMRLRANAFGDMDSAEFSALFTGGLSKPTDSSGIQNSAAHLGTFTASGAAVPSSIDWSSKGAVQTVMNQGKCGSCWAFSSVGSVVGRWEIATGTLLNISEQELVDCAHEGGKTGNAGCTGGVMELAFEHMQTHDMCSEVSYPYEGKEEGACHAAGCKVALPKGSVAGFKDVIANDTQAILEALQSGPVSVGVDANSMDFQFYWDGVFKSDTCGEDLDHAVLLVGYGVDGDKAYWKVKNSWGAAWGESGYIRLARSNASHDPGMCGIQINPSFPILKAHYDLNVALV